jgi:hypothetical protein
MEMQLVEPSEAAVHVCPEPHPALLDGLQVVSLTFIEHWLLTHEGMTRWG